MFSHLNNIVKTFALLSLLIIGSNANAESSQDFGDYVIHYNAFRSDLLSPDMAKAYNLTRRNNRLILNIAVLKKVLNTTGTPTAANVTGHIKNLMGQMRDIEFREIKEGTAIYYLAESQFSNDEILMFELNVIPEGSNEAASVKFKKRFSTY
ncbi:MAG: DUF4426 domain-containing protein [Gammaproteobacteria bacterium]|nr:DUF4426 domain-containing protein [Gammaproteobacteria bacterium]